MLYQKKENGINPFGGVEWVAWLGATIAACVSLSAYAYRNFQTRDAALEEKGDLVQRLDRIEVKVDQLLKK